MIRATAAGLSLREFCRTVYLPSRLGITPDAAANLLRCARQYDELIGLPVSDLTDETVVTYLQSLVANGSRPATVNGSRSKILALWRCAWRKGVLDQLPRDVPRMTEPSDPPRARQTDEIAALFRHCLTLTGTVGGIKASDWWASLFAAVACTGERPGAVIRSKPEDCDLAGGWIWIRSGTVKTKKGRLYPLADWAVAAIARVHDPARSLLWPWPHCRRHLYTRARRVMEASGIRPSREYHDLFYSLRRWNLSHLAAESIALAQQQSGHASVATLRRHYLDPRVLANRRAVEVLPILPAPATERQLRLAGF